MGRLAGPGVDWEAARKRFAKEQEQRRYLASITPVAHPPASRRQMALLWYIRTNFPEAGLIVGRRGYPPLTGDMRALLGKKYLGLSRAAVYATLRLPLCNLLKITSAGMEKLDRQRVSDEDRRYITLAMSTGIVR